MRRAGARLTLIGAALAATALALSAAAQPGFRVTYSVDRSGSDQMQLTGTVRNESSLDVFDVSLTAEALDARDRVVARGITHVSARIPSQGSAPFVCKVPLVPAAVRYRAAVTAFRTGTGPQSP
jgi:hypothetical protein